SFGLSLSKPGFVGWFERHARVERGGRESPGGRVTFFRFAERKSPKKGRPPVCDPFALRRGNLRRDGCGVRRETHCAPLALRSDSHGELDNEACALRRARSPCNRPAPGAASRGGTAEQPNSQHGPLLRPASRSRRVALAPARSGPSE